MRTIGIVFLLATIACESAAQKKEKASNTNLIGSWNWVKSHYHTKDTSFIWRGDIVGRMILTERDYSFMIIDQQGPRDPLKTPGWKANSKEVLQNTLSKVYANAGHYEIKGDTLFLIHEIALWPHAMAAESKPSKYAVSWSKDTLVLNQGISTEYWLKRKHK